MSYVKTFIGEELDLMMYKGNDIIDFTFTVTNSDDSAYDFTGITDINLIIYDHRDGTVLKTLVITDNLTVASNVVTLNADYSADINLDTSDLRYYELVWNDSASRPITICYNNLKIV